MPASAPQNHHYHHDIQENALAPMPHQVGGHRPKTADEAPYMLRLEPPLSVASSSSSSSSYPPRPRLLKVVQAGDKGERELAFYQRLFKEEEGEKREGGNGDAAEAEQQSTGGIWKALQPFVPSFYGVQAIHANGLSHRYLILEDLSLPPSFPPTCCLPTKSDPKPSLPASLIEHYPSILDVKIGQRSHPPWAPSDKVAREQIKHPHQKDVGFRIVGMKIYEGGGGRGEKGGAEEGGTEGGERKEENKLACTSSMTIRRGGYVSEGKEYGRGLRPGKELKEGLARFFLRGMKEGREEEGVLKRLDLFIKRLEGLKKWFSRQRCLKFWSSSLLFVDHRYYDSQHKDKEQEQEEQQQQLQGNGGEKGGGRIGEVWKEGRWRVEEEDVDLRMIDFAHVQIRGEEGEGGWEEGDVNYMYGLSSLLRHLKELREDAKGVARSRQRSK